VLYSSLPALALRVPDARINTGAGNPGTFNVAIGWSELAIVPMLIDSLHMNFRLRRWRFRFWALMIEPQALPKLRSRHSLGQTYIGFPHREEDLPHY
jgi:hypothetical protein